MKLVRRSRDRGRQSWLMSLPKNQVATRTKRPGRSDSEEATRKKRLGSGGAAESAPRLVTH